MKILQFFIVIVGLGCANGFVQAQMTLDRIIGVIGEEIILQSDVENQYNYLVINGQKDDGNLRCEVMDQLIVSKLLLNKAIQDSVEITEEQVESELDRRIGFMVSQMGGEQEFERIYMKSLAQFRMDTRGDIRESLLIERMRNIVLTELTITPREVKTFFKSLPEDSLGFLPAEVQLNQIVVVPPFDPGSKRDALDHLEEIRRSIVEDGKDFGLQAVEYSEGPSGPRGGNLGDVRRGQMVPRFEEVIFNMREGEVSKPFETDFGFHIAKLIKIKGQIRECSHILIIPDRNSNADSIAIDSLNKILRVVQHDSLTFEQAAIRFSQDRATKDCGGCISDPKTGELRISMDQLDSDLYFKIEEMEEGEISSPMEYKMMDGTNAFHLLYLKRKIPPHEPNLKDDYKKIQNAAMQAKQSEKFEAWLESAKNNIYIDIKPTECTNALKSWIE